MTVSDLLKQLDGNYQVQTLKRNIAGSNRKLRALTDNKILVQDGATKDFNTESESFINDFKNWSGIQLCHKKANDNEQDTFNPSIDYNTFIRIGNVDRQLIELIFEGIEMYFDEGEYDIDNAVIYELEDDEQLQVFLWIEGGASRIVNQLADFSKDNELWVELSDLENIDIQEIKPHTKHIINWGNYIMFNLGEVEEGEGYIYDQYNIE
jgi:hypothetical protein